jgi:hypothetical protein
MTSIFELQASGLCLVGCLSGASLPNHLAISGLSYGLCPFVIVQRPRGIFYGTVVLLDHVGGWCRIFVLFCFMDNFIGVKLFLGIWGP